MMIAEDMSAMEVSNIIIDLESDMHLAARNLEFERAAQIRDKIKELRTSYAL